MTKATIRTACLALSALAAAAVGCKEADDSPYGEGGPDDTTGDTGAECLVTVDEAAICAAPATGAFNLADQYNYNFQSELTVSSIPVQGQQNLLFDWSQLTTDFLGRPVDPLIDIDLALVTVWSLSPEALMQKINDDAVEQSEMIAVAMSYPKNDRTSDYLLNCQLYDNPLTPEDIMPYFDNTSASYSPQTITHMLMAASGTVAGKGARMLQFFYLDPASTNTTVSINNSSTTLDWSVDLRSLQRLGLKTGAAGLIAVDWVNLTTNSMGLEFLPLQITRAVVANYASMDICQLEKNFIELESLATKWYSKDITEGTSVALQELTLQDLTPFQGIDHNGIWILALICGECANPAPWFITVLQPCG